MYKTVIIEDDPFSQEVLKDMLHQHFSELDVVAVFDSVKSTLEKLPKIEVDLVLLDMELLDGLGFDVLTHYEEINFEVIITTMHNSYMLEAIKHSALDYLMKPITKQELAPAIERFVKKMEKLERLKNVSAFKKSNRLVLPNQNGLILLEIKDIVRLESDGAYTRFFVVDGTQHLVSKNLGFYEAQLAHHGFSRVHHKHLISLSHVKNYVRGEGGTIVMSDNSSVEVSRRKKEEFLKSLEG